MEDRAQDVNSDETLPSVTIVIATFNSTPTLPKVLEGIARQDYPADKIELLAVDGGSTDETIDMIERFGGRWIPNPRTEPVYAKYLALHEVTSDAIVYLDHDEVMCSPSSIRRKAMTLADDVFAVTVTGYVNPDGCAPVNDYINEFGDPFSAFMYRFSKHVRFYPKAMRRRYAVVRDTVDATVFDMSGEANPPIIELCASGSMTDVRALRREIPEALDTPANVPHLFYLMLPHVPTLALAKDDPLEHYSADTLRAYLRKIRWRVKNNIHFAAMGESGFGGRQRFGSAWFRAKKFLFLPYALTLVLPLLEGIWMSLTRRNPVYLLHPVLCAYTAGLIVFHMTLKVLGHSPQLLSYDETTVVQQDPESIDS